MRKCFNVVALALFSGLLVAPCAADAPPDQAQSTAEIITWPRQTSDELFVARETLQPFYIMAYARGEKIDGATKVEISVPANWQVWRGSDALPTPGVLPAGQPQVLTFDLIPRTTKDSAKSKEYTAALSAANILLVARALPGAQAGSTLELLWKSENKVLAARKVALVPLELLRPETALTDSTNVAMWMNDPKFNAQTMADVYRGLRRAGVDTVIITRAMFAQNRGALRELKMKVWISQWWGFREYLPTPPPEAVSKMKDGTINSKRWSPTYMAEGGAEFIQGVEKIADELKEMDGIAGLLLDYEPGAEGLDADYGAASQAAFEKAIGEKIADWPAAVLPGGKLEEKWIDFRNDQSEAYIHWFRKIIRERAPGLQLSVSTSGATGTPDDMNRRLAATDIGQLSRASDAVFPQLYSWTSELPQQLDRFNEKLELGRTTLAGTQSKTIPLVGSLAGGKIPLADPKYLRMQILDWWFHGADGFGVWQYFYGVDGRYLQMTSELSTLFEAAGTRAQGEATQKLSAIVPIHNLQIFNRKSSDGKTLFVGLFNYTDQEITLPQTYQQKKKAVLPPLFAQKMEATVKTIAPWSAQVLKISIAN